MMDSASSDSLSQISENKYREQNLSNDDKSALSVPEIGRNSSEKVSKLGPDVDLGGSLKEQSSGKNPEVCSIPGEPMPVLNNTEETGVDCTREPDWEVVKPNQLPDQPEPSQFHNDKFWDERSLDTQLQNQDLQEKMIREEQMSFERASEVSGDDGRAFLNEVLDPYHAGGRPPSETSSAQNSLDSFI